MESRKPDISYKVLLVGSCGVGKTSLLRRLSGKDLNKRVLTTVAPDFAKVHFRVESALVELCVWDTPGQERFLSTTKQQLIGIDGVVLVYSIADTESFKLMDYWIDSLTLGDQMFGSMDCQLPMIMVGNKRDLEAERQVDKMLAEKLSYRNCMVGFDELSALSGEGVRDIFHRLASFMIESLHPKLVRSFSPLSNGKEEMALTMMPIASLKPLDGDTKEEQTENDHKPDTCCKCSIL